MRVLQLSAWRVAVRVATTVLLLLLGNARAHAVCSAIPAPPQEFTSTLGAIDRPFASPNDPVRLRCPPPTSPNCPTPSPDQLVCDGSQLGRPSECPTIDPDKVIVSVVFNLVKGKDTEPRMVVLGRKSTLDSLDACASPPGTPPAAAGSRSITCVEDRDLGIVQRGNTQALEFRFPDTSAGLALCLGGTDEGHCCSSDANNDCRDCAEGACVRTTLTGPAMIAVTNANAAFPLPDPMKPCAPRDGLLACIDTFPQRETFPSFTALPRPNDYGALCDGSNDVCTGGAEHVEIAADSDGNLLIPVDWSRVVLGDVFAGLGANDRPLIRRIQDGLALGRQSIELPVARLVLFQTDVDAFPGGHQPIHLPDRSYLTAYTPAGVRLPPIFEPQTDREASDGLVLFGSADAQRSVLRVARGCVGDTCQIRTCDGGDFPGIPCATDDDCGCVGAGAMCACRAGLFDFSSRLLGGIGPIVISRRAFDAHELGAVSLDGLVQTTNLNTFVVHEALARRDLNQNGNFGDDVIVVQDRQSGAKRTLAGVTGRAVTRVQVRPFSFYAVAAADDSVPPADAGGIVALLEPEGLDDINGDGDTLDTILRVFHRRDRDGGLQASSLPITVDAAPLINGRSFAISDGLVFFRVPEAAGAPHRTTAISVTPTGAEANRASLHATISGNGRFVAFASDATNLTDQTDANSKRDVFVRDLCVADGERVADCLPTQVVSTPEGGDFPSISQDGRFVAYVTPPPGPSSLYVWDRQGETPRLVSDSVAHEFPAIASVGEGFVVAFSAHPPGAATEGVYVFSSGEPCAASIAGSNEACVSRISDADFPANAPAVSQDGSFVAYLGEGMNGSRLCARVGETSYCRSQVLVYDRGCAGPIAGCTELASATPNGAPSVNGPTPIFPPPAVSADGRFVAFVSSAVDLGVEAEQRPGVYVHDRNATGPIKTTLVHGKGGAFVTDLAANGRFVAVGHLVTEKNLIAFSITDQLTGLSTELVSAAETRMSLDVLPTRPSLSSDGRVMAFEAKRASSTLTDVFVRDVGGPHSVETGAQAGHPRDVAADVTKNGFVGETVLEVLDATTGAIEVACPATQVAVSNGRAAFLRPESAGGTPNCPGPPSGDLNGDGDDLDSVVQLLERTNGKWQVSNLGKAATAIAFARDHIAALVSEHDQSGAPRAPEETDDDLNDDGDVSDNVVHVYSTSTKRWINFVEAASKIDASGDVVAYLASDVALGDEILRIVHFSPTIFRVFGWDSAVDFVLGPATDTNRTPLVAYRTREADRTGQCDLNGDGDCIDTILRAFRYPYDRAPADSASAATTCTFETCDPRVPYRVGKNTVTFLTLTAQNKNSNNPQMPATENDLVVQVMDVLGGTIRVLGAVHAGTCAAKTPTPEVHACVTDADCPDGDSCRLTPGCVAVGTDTCDEDADCERYGPGAFCGLAPGNVPPSPKQCIRFGRACADNGDCASLNTSVPKMTATCENGAVNIRGLTSPFAAPLGGGRFFTSVGRCANDPGEACGIDSDCGNSPTNVCELRPTIATASDADDDEIPDVFDTCPTVANAEQNGTCAELLCGDGVVTRPFEICDDGHPAGGPEANDTCVGCTKLCAPQPRGNCHTAADEPQTEARILIRRASQGRTSLEFSWPEAPAAMSEFGDPSRTSSFALCVYDRSGTAEPLLEAHALAEERCANGPCWKRLHSRGFQYTNPTRNGELTSVTLAAKPNGKARIRVRGKDVSFATTSMPFALPVTVQLVNSDSASCWQAEFTAADSNSATELRAVSTD